MMHKAYLQRAIEGAKAKKAVLQESRRKKAVRAREQVKELQESRRVVRRVQSERQKAKYTRQRRENEKFGRLTVGESALGPEVPTLTHSASAKVPALPLHALTGGPAPTRRPASAKAQAKTKKPPRRQRKGFNHTHSGLEGVTGPGKPLAVMPQGKTGQATPSNVWVMVNDLVAKQARRDEAAAKARRLAHAAQWQKDLAKQTEFQRRAREEKFAYDMRYDKMSDTQIRDGNMKEQSKKEKLRAKALREKQEREKQVASARRRREAELQREREEDIKNARIMAQRAAQATAKEEEKRRAAKKWLAEVAAENQRSMTQAHSQMLKQLEDDKKLSAVWQAQLDAADRRRQAEFDSIYAKADAMEAFGATQGDTSQARLKADEERAARWRRHQEQAEDRKWKAKREAAARRVKEQQAHLAKQMEEQERLRKKALDEELSLQRTLIKADEDAVAQKKREQAEKRQRNIEYRRELERQRAFDRRRATNERRPGAMSKEEVLMNRHLVKVSLRNHLLPPPAKVYGSKAAAATNKLGQTAADSKRTTRRRLQRTGSSLMSK